MSELAGEARNFHKPGKNYETDGYKITSSTMVLLEKHLKCTGGRVFTRFPPEPNGVLHIGHAKAINFNFGYAKRHGGVCYLRYDDTNPEKEEEQFFNNILEMVTWLGFAPYKITYASDNFAYLYECAKKMIKAGHAYVCHQTVDEIRGLNTADSPWRDRPINESLKLFDDMKHGKIEEGKATLRLKYEMKDGKRDPVAYRIKFVPHHRSGSDWCIYPTYDFTHPLCDSVENISHSLCTKEFQSHRPLYYWLCNALDVYCPVQWEYGRMNIGYTVLSKRKILKLVESGIVRDWDDPRLFTLAALKRRGFPAESINDFCETVGVTMSQTVLEPALLESCVRNVLNRTARRTMAVLRPIKVTIINLQDAIQSSIEVLDFPGDDKRGRHHISMTNVIYIDEEDFSEQPPKGYRRLTMDQPVGLRYAGLVISVSSIERDTTTGKINHILADATQVADVVKKPKCFIHWVADPVHCEVRNYGHLFTEQFPEKNRNGFMAALNSNSLEILDAVIDRYMMGSAVLSNYQFERLGYYTVDPDSTADKLVFNKTVDLKEDPGKVL